MKRHKTENISVVFETLQELMRSKNTYFTFKDIPDVLIDDLKAFMVGHTISKDKNGEFIIGKNLFNSWIEKLKHKGIDYEIKFKTR